MKNEGSKKPEVMEYKAEHMKGTAEAIKDTHFEAAEVVRIGAPEHGKKD